MAKQIEKPVFAQTITGFSLRFFSDNT